MAPVKIAQGVSQDRTAIAKDSYYKRHSVENWPKNARVIHVYDRYLFISQNNALQIIDWKTSQVVGTIKNPIKPEEEEEKKESEDEENEDEENEDEEDDDEERWELDEKYAEKAVPRTTVYCDGEFIVAFLIRKINEKDYLNDDEEENEEDEEEENDEKEKKKEIIRGTLGVWRLSDVLSGNETPIRSTLFPNMMIMTGHVAIPLLSVGVIAFAENFKSYHDDFAAPDCCVRFYDFDTFEKFGSFHEIFMGDMYESVAFHESEDKTKAVFAVSSTTMGVNCYHIHKSDKKNIRHTEPISMDNDSNLFNIFVDEKYLKVC